jgi:hypothetical protein
MPKIYDDELDRKPAPSQESKPAPEAIPEFGNIALYNPNSLLLILILAIVTAILIHRLRSAQTPSPKPVAVPQRKIEAGLSPPRIVSVDEFPDELKRSRIIVGKDDPELPAMDLRISKPDPDLMIVTVER